ncbi:MAG: TlpA disulfide reductase family protein [Thermodesulfobacteriota bacterium]
MRRIMPVVLAVCLAWPALSLGTPAEGQKSPSFRAETLDGKVTEVGTAGNGNALLLVFWATWCPHCLNDIPELNAIHAKYAPKGLDLVGINVGVNDSIPRVQSVIQKFKIAYPIVFDQGSKITRLYEITGAPTFVLVDREGVVRLSLPGGPAAKVLSKLEQIFK